MLTVQPNFSQKRMYSAQLFGNSNPYKDSYYNEDELSVLDYDYESDSYERESDFSGESDKEKDLLDMKNGINKTIENIKGLEEEVNLPGWAKNGVGLLYTLGAAAVAGIGTKFGFTKTSEYLGELSNKNTIKKATSNIRNSLKKLGKSIMHGIDTLKNTSLYKSISNKFSEMSKSFGKTSFGKKLNKFADSISKNKFVVKVKNAFKNIKNVNSAKIVDGTGDVLGAATGVSTAAVGVIDPEQKEKLEG